MNWKRFVKRPLNQNMEEPELAEGQIDCRQVEIKENGLYSNKICLGGYELRGVFGYEIKREPNGTPVLTIEIHPKSLDIKAESSI